MTIIVRTNGGLGNQLFQYAFGRAISEKLKTKFLLDIDLSVIHKGLRVHAYSLGHFNTKVTPAKWYNMFGFVGIKRFKKIFYTFYGKLPWKKKLMPFFYTERTFMFDPEACKNNTYFEGFWQTEKYFKDIEEDIRKEITITKPLSDYSKQIKDSIKKTNAVSLHVRRTDYVTHEISNIHHGICSIEYYQNAVKYIENNLPSPHFFIFSDDYEWSVENFKFLKQPYTCIKNGPDKNYEDLTLMALCKAHIIANSSFSWWGAWLDPRKDKIVIAPKKWFANAPKNNTSDLLPQGWITI